jgi:hypothetical protein
MNCFAIQSLEQLQHRPVNLVKQSIRNVYLVIWIDANKVRIKGGVVNSRKGHTVGDKRLPQICRDMGCIEK